MSVIRDIHKEVIDRMAYNYLFINVIKGNGLVMWIKA